MFYIDKNIVHLTRGDDATVVADIYLDGAHYDMQSGDTLILTVKTSTGNSGELIFEASSTTNSIHISHEDTANAAVGQYSFDIQLVRANGNIYTIFPSKGMLSPAMLQQDMNWQNFWLMPEVTTHE